MVTYSSITSTVNVCREYISEYISTLRKMQNEQHTEIYSKQDIKIGNFMNAITTV